MKELLVKDIIKVTNGKLIIGNENLVCNNFSKDTRTINKDDVYIGIKGEKFDGSKFWKEALNNGASSVIISNIEITKEEKENFKGKTIIIVEDTLKALYEIAKLKRSLYNIPVIAITGSVGKTSTKDIIASVISKKYKTLKTIGNNNNNIGLPFTILKLKDEETLVLEMGMNHFGEIKLLSNIAKPDICVITNIGTSHIGNLGSRQNILKAKLEILEGNKNAYVVINNDNDLLHEWYEKNKNNNKIYTYGIKNKSDFNAKNLKLEEESSNFICETKEEQMNVELLVAGEHFVSNALSAIAVAKILNIDTNKILEGIKGFELTKKRMDIANLKNGIKIINDAYNASFESMQASLKTLSKYEGTTKIAVLGDMFELGDFSKELHEKVGKEVCKNNIDILICSGENSKYIIESAKKNGMKEENIYYFENKDKIVEKLKDIIKPNTVILFKASNAMKFFELAKETNEILSN